MIVNAYRARLAVLGLSLACSAMNCYASPTLTPTTASAATNNAAADIDWAQYQGKVVYIDFWASWCGPCKASFPWMNAMHSKYAKQGLVILAINVDQEPAKAAAFLQQNPAQFSIKYDRNGALASQFAVQTMPSSFILGRDGKPVSKHKGFSPSKVASYEAEIQQLLAK